MFCWHDLWPPAFTHTHYLCLQNICFSKLKRARVWPTWSRIIKSATCGVNEGMMKTVVWITSVADLSAVQEKWPDYILKVSRVRCLCDTSVSFPDTHSSPQASATFARHDVCICVWLNLKTESECSQKDNRATQNIFLQRSLIWKDNLRLGNNVNYVFKSTSITQSPHTQINTLNMLHCVKHTFLILWHMRCLIKSCLVCVFHMILQIRFISGKINIFLVMETRGEWYFLAGACLCC